MKKNKNLRNGIILIALTLILGFAGLYYTGFFNKIDIPNGEQPTFELQHFTDKAQLKSEYDILNNIKGGLCYQNWQPTDLSYENMECINSQIWMYDNTKDIKYLDQATANLNFLYNKAYDCTNVAYAWKGHTDVFGDGNKEWRCYLAYTSGADHLWQGKVSWGFANYVDVVQKNNELTHKADAEKFKTLVLVDHLNDIKSTWYEWTVGNEVRGCYGAKESDGKITCNNHNRVAHDYDILLYAYDWTGDVKYKEQYTKWARYFKSILVVKQDTTHLDSYYQWNYADWDKSVSTTNVCNKNLCFTGEVGGKAYTQWDIQPILHGYKDGIFWTKTDMTLFANIITKAVSIKTDVIVDGVTKPDQYVLNYDINVPQAKSWSNTFSETAKPAMWVDFAVIQPEIFNIFEQITYNDYMYKKTSNDWKKAYYQCVINPLVSTTSPVCTYPEDYNVPTNNMMQIAKIYKLAKE